MFATRILLVLDLIVNLLIVIGAAYSLYHMTFRVPTPKVEEPNQQPTATAASLTSTGNNKKVFSSHCFRYFTVDSNLLVGLASLAVLICCVCELFNSGASAVPQIVSIIKYIGTTCVALTFLTVVFYLIPVAHLEDMFSGVNFFMHFLVPILSILSFIFLDDSAGITWVHALLVLIPVILFGLVYIYMVLIRTEANGGWKDFYGFNQGGKWYIMVPTMFIATYAISILLIFLRNLRLLLY